MGKGFSGVAAERLVDHIGKIGAGQMLIVKATLKVVFNGLCSSIIYRDQRRATRDSLVKVRDKASQLFLILLFFLFSLGLHRFGLFSGGFPVIV